MKDSPTTQPLENQHNSTVSDGNQISFARVMQPSDRLAAPPHPSNTASDSASSHLPRVSLQDLGNRAEGIVDRLHTPDGVFTGTDLARLTEDFSIKGQDAIALAALYEMNTPENVGEIQAPRPPLNTATLVRDLAHQGLNPENEANSLLDADRLLMGRLYQQLTQRASAPHSDALYADSVNPLNSINPRDIHQGSAADCWFEGALSTVAERHPELIRDSITDNKNGTYTVKFKGDPDHPVTIQRPTDAELALYNGASQDGIWAAVMEKGMARYMTDVQHRVQNGTTRIDTSAGGDPYDSLQLLTGHDPDQLAFGVNRRAEDQSQAAEAQRIAHTVNSGLSATLSTTGDAPRFGLTENHTYAIAGYQPGPEGGRILLRNPDQHEPGTQPSSISLDAIDRMNGVVTIETTNSPQKPVFTMPGS